MKAPARSPESATPRRRTGGRSARVVRDVLDATIEVLAHRGYVAFSFEEVAERAGVSRTTIYRRWPAKQDLVRAALLKIAEEHHSVHDTGSLRGDLLEFTCEHIGAEHVERDIRVFRALIAGFDDPELRALARVALDRAMQPSVAAIERAIARGELPAGTDPAAVLEPLVFTSILRHLMQDAAPRPEDEARLVDLVLAGARSGAATRR